MELVMFFLRRIAIGCPNCGKTVEIVYTTSIRVVVENKNCQSCGKTCRTGAIEWTHLNTRDRIEFFFNENTIGLLLFLCICSWYRWADHSYDGQFLSFVCTLILSVLVVLLWVIKWIDIWRSNSRTSQVLQEHNS